MFIEIKIKVIYKKLNLPWKVKEIFLNKIQNLKKFIIYILKCYNIEFKFLFSI